MDGAERAKHRVASACKAARTPSELLAAVQQALEPYVPADRWCALTLDPGTVLPTGGVHEQGFRAQNMPRLLELELSGEDANAFAALSRQRRAAATLSEGTRGRHDASARYRDVFVPEGMRHELRAVFRDEAGAWAGLVLMRGSDHRDFSAAELAVVSRVSDDVCRALRALLLSVQVQREASAQGPGLLLLAESSGAGFGVVHANEAAQRWIDEIDDGAAGRLPYALYSLALRARADAHARARIRTRTGCWLTAHAERMTDGGISLILEPSRPHELARVLAAAYGLTAREAQVVRLVAAGYSNPDIAQALCVSRYTVEDHLRHVYEKLSVNTRSALTAKLFFDQYLPRTGTPLSSSGWFSE